MSQTKAPQTDEAAERDATTAAYKKAVNMTHAALRTWLDSEQSPSSGMVPAGGHEAIGHALGHSLVAIQRKRTAELTKADLAPMRKKARAPRLDTSPRVGQPTTSRPHAGAPR